MFYLDQGLHLFLRQPFGQTQVFQTGNERNQVQANKYITTQSNKLQKIAENLNVLRQVGIKLTTVLSINRNCFLVDRLTPVQK